jgi:hypothetical protein
VAPDVCAYAAEWLPRHTFRGGPSPFSRFLVLALVVCGLYAGSQQRRLPAPFGRPPTA